MDIRQKRLNGAPAKPPQTGLTLIEVLIALVVLSIGLAGLASMHLSSVQYVHSSLSLIHI